MANQEIKVRSLTRTDFRPDTNRAQQRLTTKLYAKHGVDFAEVKRAIKGGDVTQARRLMMGRAGAIEAEKWVAENAVSRGLSVKQYLRLMQEAKINQG